MQILYRGARLFEPEQSWIWLILASPWLLFPNQVPHWPAAATVLLAGPLLVTFFRNQRVWVATPLSVPILLLAGTVVMGFIISPFPDLSRPKFAGVILGVFAFRAVVLHGTSPPRIRMMTRFFLLVGVCSVTSGLLNTELNHKAWAGWDRFTMGVPHIALSVPGTHGSINPNALGGTTLMFLPLAIALCASERNTRFRVLALLSTIVLSAVLALSQSRTAWLSLAVTMAVLGAVRWRLHRWSGAFIGAVVVGTMAWAQRHAQLEPVDAGAATRFDIWLRAAHCIQDAPWTGIGLNTFRRVVHLRYPFPGYRLSPVLPSADIAHAHNVFLQTALDVGLPGLILYMVVLVTASIMAWQTYTRSDAPGATIVLGVWGGVLGIHLFGMTDAIVLGSKVGLFFWWALGLLAAQHGDKCSTIRAARGRRCA